MNVIAQLVSFLLVALNPALVSPAPDLINYQGIDQSRIDKVFEAYTDNATLPEDAIKNGKYDDISSGFYLAGVGGNFKHRDGSEDEQFLMMASTSKLVTTLYGLLSAEDKVEIDISILQELLYRDPGRLNDKPGIYDPILKGKFKLTDSEIDDLANQTSNYYTVYSKMRDRESSISYKLPLAELLYHDLTLSSNTAAELIKNLGIQGDPEFAQSRMNHLLGTPNYELTIAISGITHWRQSASNTGLLSEHAELLHRLVRSYQRTALPDDYNLIVESIIDNKQDYDFDFTNSDLGKQLRKDGWQILEKTGYYPVVFWVMDLANGKKGSNPPHMTFSTLVSLIPPKNSTKDVLSFGYYKNVEVAAPPKRTADLSTGLSVPNDWKVDVSPVYLQDYLDQVRKESAAEFRKGLAQQVTPYL